MAEEDEKIVVRDKYGHYDPLVGLKHVIVVEDDLLWNEVAVECQRILNCFSAFDRNENTWLYEHMLTMLESFTAGLLQVMKDEEMNK